MKLKLDLHTHCGEATFLSNPTVEIVAKIVDAVKAKGLDGIGVTEHYDKAYGYKVKEIVEQHFNNEVLIIPGHEIDIGFQQVVELDLPCGATFRILVHPYFSSFYSESHLAKIDNLQAIEIDNSMHTWEMNKPRIRAFAEEHNLMLLSNSDAHHLSDIGIFYNEVDLDELCALANSARR